jgi:GTP cyclohydrolase IA
MTIAEATDAGHLAPRLELIRGGPDIDLARAERAVAELLAALGQDVDDEHTRDTPRRVAAAYAEMLTPRAFNLTTFPNDEAYDELVLARDIPFRSLCEHHLLPFHGVAHVGDLPGRVVGISKLARLVHCFARRLQIQERMTQQVAQAVETHLEARGVGVVVSAHHLCMGCRGVRLPSTQLVTSAMLGTLRKDSGTRSEFLRLCGTT